MSKRWGFRGQIKLSTPTNYVFLQHLKYTNPRERPKTAQVWTLGMPLTGCVTLGKSLKPLLVSLLTSGEKKNPKTPQKNWNTNVILNRVVVKIIWLNTCKALSTVLGTWSMICVSYFIHFSVSFTKAKDLSLFTEVSCLKWCLTHSRCTVSISWMNKHILPLE